MTEERVNLKNASEKLIEGANLLTDAVRVTLGPSGNTVVIMDEGGIPHVTKDGATVSVAVSSPDPEVNCGIELVRQAAVKTAKEAGDGTTTATILACSLINNLKDEDPVKACRAIDWVVEKVTGEIRKYSQEVGEDLNIIEGVATISANGDREVGKMVREAYEKTGMGVNIILSEGFGEKTVLSATKGIKFQKGYESVHFVNNPDKGAFEMNNCNILLFENPLTVPEDIMQEFNLEPRTPYLIIAPSFSSSVVTFAISSLRSSYWICLVQAEGWGDSQREHIRDIAALITEGVFVQDSSYCGQVDKVIVDAMSASIIGCKGTPVQYISSLRSRAQSCEVEELRDQLLNRASILENGTCSIVVGAKTQSELKERMDRYEDAIYAVRSAVQEGVLPGGGISFMNIWYNLRELPEVAESPVLTKALGCICTPFDTLADLCNVSVDTIGLENCPNGIDFTTGEKVNCLEAGILDAAKVERVALENAASVAKMILSTKCIINTRQE